MHPTPLPDGQQVFVDSFGENPLEAIGHNMRIAQVRAPADGAQYKDAIAGPTPQRSSPTKSSCASKVPP